MHNLITESHSINRIIIFLGSMYYVVMCNVKIYFSILLFSTLYDFRIVDEILAGQLSCNSEDVFRYPIYFDGK